VELTQTSIRTWADENGIPSLIMAEQDLRLLYALRAIYSDPYLSSRLGLKGGTALNKLYFPELGRLSLDLDFNALGTKEGVFSDRWPVVDRITAHLTRQDSNYVIKTNYSYEQTTIRARYLPTLGTRSQSIKLEISFVERFPILAPVVKSLEIPALGEPLSIQSYALEELVATKIRALHDRMKGRDIYDLDQAATLPLDETVVRKMVLYYFYRARQVFDYKSLLANVQKKLSRPRFVNDLQGFLRADATFQFRQVVDRVISSYSFLADSDERDTIFLLLVRHLLGQPIPGSRRDDVQAIEFPLRYLFEGHSITPEARNVTVDDIRLYGKA
jgi:predicted nucleotidyltransferase component of viral defense system